MILLSAYSNSQVFPIPPRFAHGTSRVDIAVVDYAFKPARENVTTGTTVVWTYVSNGTDIHTVTSKNTTQNGSPVFASTNPNPLHPGQSYSFTFNLPGNYAYYCAVHPTLMNGWVNVTGQPVTPPPDFGIRLDQSSLSVVAGSSGSATITLTSQNGFAGSVSLTATVSPSGPSVSFSPVTVPLTSGGSATSKLSITTSSGLYSNTPTGNYTVTVTATGSSSLSHSVTLPVTVTSSSSPAASIPASVLIIAGFGILAVAVAVVVVYAVLRRRRHAVGPAMPKGSNGVGNKSV